MTSRPDSPEKCGNRLTDGGVHVHLLMQVPRYVFAADRDAPQCPRALKLLAGILDCAEYEADATGALYVVPDEARLQQNLACGSFGEQSSIVVFGQ